MNNESQIKMGSSFRWNDVDPGNDVYPAFARTTVKHSTVIQFPQRQLLWFFNHASTAGRRSFFTPTR